MIASDGNGGKNRVPHNRTSILFGPWPFGESVLPVAYTLGGKFLEYMFGLQGYALEKFETYFNDWPNLSGRALTKRYDFKI